MEFIVKKGLNSPETVRAHKLFGSAVFIECGVHDPENFCYDHHSMSGDGSRWSLSSAGMIQQELLQRREMPNVVVMNHIRHLDNIVSLYLLQYRRLVMHPETSEIVSVAELMDRVGPLAIASLPRIPLSVLETAQNLIPFKEWEESDEKLQEFAILAIESLRGMVTASRKQAQYELLHESDDGKFVIVKSGEPLGNTLYNEGIDAYVAWDEKSKYTLARASEYVPFDIPSAIQELNELEDSEEGSWGGRSIVGGSPQNVGTKLTSETIIEIVKKHWD